MRSRAARRAARARLPRTAPSRRRQCAPRASLGQRAEEWFGPQDPERLAPRLGRRPVEDQDPVEVVELVLHHARIALLEIELDVLAVLVLALDRDLGRSFDRNRHALHREAALRVAELYLGRLRQSGIDERPWGLVLALRLEDEHPPQGADLRPCKPDAVRFLHQLFHPLDEPAQIVVEALDLVRAHPQHRIGVLPDLRQREPSTRLAFRVELLFENLTLLFDVFVSHGASLWTAKGSADPRRRPPSARLCASPAPLRRGVGRPARRRAAVRLSWRRAARDGGREAGRAAPGRGSRRRAFRRALPRAPGSQGPAPAR